MISELMANRGPDDSGSWHDAHCNLVFRRLSILDLYDAGHQPMVSPDGRYVLVFNGEVYNFIKLRQQLEQRGTKFRSHSDSEVVLYSLMEWGRDALDRFNGMFVLGFYDTHERKLLLARGHAGIKPLYCLHHSKGLMFASQYDQLLAHPWSKNLPKKMPIKKQQRFVLKKIRLSKRLILNPSRQDPLGGGLKPLCFSAA